MTALPEWPAGTGGVLPPAGDEPHAIPVSTAVRRGPRSLAFALGLRRESLARLRADPSCALTLLAAGNVAVTVIGRASVVAEVEQMAIVHVSVERIQNHARDTFVVDGGAQWRWTDEDAKRADAAVRRA